MSTSASENGDFSRRAFVEEAVELAARTGSEEPWHPYVGRVLERLRIGADRYGDHDFRQKDVAEELLQESPDVAAYAALLTERNYERMVAGDLPENQYQELRMAALAVAVMGAKSDQAAERYLVLERELSS